MKILTYKNSPITLDDHFQVHDPTKVSEGQEISESTRACEKKAQSEIDEQKTILKGEEDRKQNPKKRRGEILYPKKIEGKKAEEKYKKP